MLMRCYVDGTRPPFSRCVKYTDYGHSQVATMATNHAWGYRLLLKAKLRRTGIHGTATPCSRGRGRAIRLFFGEYDHRQKVFYMKGRVLG